MPTTMIQPEPYPAPLYPLNSLGLDESEQPASVDYRALGIGPDAIPALISIVADRRYDTALLPAAWAPLHAWRALGALRAVEAVEPLTALLARSADDDWLLDDVPRALGMIGAPAIRRLTEYLAEREHPVWSRIAAATALTEIAQQHPDVRVDCVNVLADQLRLFATQDSEFNGFLIADLLDLRAVESASLMGGARASCGREKAQKAGEAIEATESQAEVRLRVDRRLRVQAPGQYLREPTGRQGVFAFSLGQLEGFRKYG